MSARSAAVSFRDRQRQREVSGGQHHEERSKHVVQIGASLTQQRIQRNSPDP
ncbi:hypothetical protein [Caballeronia sp. J97]|uniref:hypothetical protein n=1 Tax=Caballeronia sp. J97 TaxID=2805429 RepID=UPI002AAF3CC0|nr:hypothetical protein [Caballeronia sp. J97]